MELVIPLGLRLVRSWPYRLSLLLSQPRSKAATASATENVLGQQQQQQQQQQINVPATPGKRGRSSTGDTSEGKRQTDAGYTVR